MYTTKCFAWTPPTVSHVQHIKSCPTSQSESFWFENCCLRMLWYIAYLKQDRKPDQGKRERGIHVARRIDGKRSDANGGLKGKKGQPWSGNLEAIEFHGLPPVWHSRLLSQELYAVSDLPSYRTNQTNHFKSCRAMEDDNSYTKSTGWNCRFSIAPDLSHS